MAVTNNGDEHPQSKICCFLTVSLGQNHTAEVPCPFKGNAEAECFGSEKPRREGAWGAPQTTESMATLRAKEGVPRQREPSTGEVGLGVPETLLSAGGWVRFRR